jgi:outer membrane protein assembly factor BamB
MRTPAARLRAAAAGIFLASLAACGGERLNAEMDGRQDVVLDLGDPGEKEVLNEVRSLPFRHVEWEYRFSDRPIVRMTLAGDQLFLETPENQVVAMDRFTGRVQWIFTVETDTPLDWPPVVAEGVPERKRQLEAELQLMARRIEDQLRATGPGKETQELQKRRADLRELLRAEAYGDNVYFISRQICYCVDRLSGKLIWSRRLGFIPSARPYAIRNYVFVAGADLSRVWALDVENKGLEKTFYRAEIFNRENQILNRPIYNAPSLYFVCHDGKVYSYNVENGNLNWTYATERELKADPILYVYRHPEEAASLAPAAAGALAAAAGAGMMAPPAAGMAAPQAGAGDEKSRKAKAQRETTFLFVGGMDNAFYALDANSGALIWKYECGAPIKSPAVAVGDTVYVATEGGALHAFEVLPVHRDPKTGQVLGPRRNGALRWKLPLGSRFLFKGKERIYVLGPKNEIYAMEENSGKIMGRYPTRHLQHLPTNTADEFVYAANAAGYVYCLKESPQRY